jgi:uncharacterized phage-associated protein
MYDARAIANSILDAARRQGVRLSNLKLQKLLYFVHGRYLIETGRPLIAGEFEAWKFGPVHTLVYAAFKDFGAEDIVGHASRIDPVTRSTQPIEPVNDPTVERHVAHVVSSLGRMTAGQLVELTHAAGGAWAKTVEDAETSANLGLKIANSTIRSHFATLRVVSSDGVTKDDFGDLRENSPYSRD